MISRKMTSRRSVLLASAMGGALLFTGSALAVAADIGGGSAPVASKADRAVKALADEAWDNAIQTDFQVRSMLDMPLGDVLFLTEKQHLDKCRWAGGRECRPTSHSRSRPRAGRWTPAAF